MNKSELARVVAKIRLGDNRNVDELVIAEWYDTIGHLNFDDAIRAVTMHRQDSIEYLQPAHVIRGALRVRERRAVAASADTFCKTHAYYPLPCDRCAEDSAA